MGARSENRLLENSSPAKGVGALIAGEAEGGAALIVGDGEADMLAVESRLLLPFELQNNHLCSTQRLKLAKKDV